MWLGFCYLQLVMRKMIRNISILNGIPYVVFECEAKRSGVVLLRKIKY